MNNRYIYAFPKVKPVVFLERKNHTLGLPSEKGKTFLLSSGRAAVYQAIKLAHFAAKDVLLLPAYHCGVEIEAAIRAGVRVRYYRITPKMEVDCEHLAQVAEGEARGLFIIHYWGFPQDLSWIVPFCRNRGIMLIEDSAHGLYSRFRDQILGTFGDMGIYSLTKTLPLPDGGLLWVSGEAGDIPALAPPSGWPIMKAAVRSTLENMKNQPQNPAAWLGRVILAFKEKNGQGDTVDFPMQGEDALHLYQKGISSFSKFLLGHLDPDPIIARRRENYLLLLKRLSGLDGIEMLFKNLDEGVCPLFFPIAVKERTALEQYLRKNRIEGFVFGRHLHKSLHQGEFPESQYLSQNVLGLPVQQDLEEGDIEHIAETVNLWNQEKMNEGSVSCSRE